MSGTAAPPLELGAVFVGGLDGRLGAPTARAVVTVVTADDPPRPPPPWWKDKAKLKAEALAFLYGIVRVAVVKGVWEVVQPLFSRRRVCET